ncbi:MAG TPA: NIPSNAP family protein [Blastocatellia bacterium]|nr:NIPSNAP family protein [Blastocatellia bacterium]
MKYAFLMIIFSTVGFISALITNGQNSAPTEPQAQPATPVLAPSPSLSKDSRCFELRTYYAAPGKLEELHARFRNHTMKLFKKHGMEVVGFWGPTDKDKGSENTLVYVLAFPSREAREKAWQEFRTDPEWQAVAKESEKNGKLTDKIDSVVMKATDYSPIK